MYLKAELPGSSASCQQVLAKCFPVLPFLQAVVMRKGVSGDLLMCCFGNVPIRLGAKNMIQESPVRRLTEDPRMDEA